MEESHKIGVKHKKLQIQPAGGRSDMARAREGAGWALLSPNIRIRSEHSTTQLHCLTTRNSDYTTLADL